MKGHHKIKLKKKSKKCFHFFYYYYYLFRRATGRADTAVHYDLTLLLPCEAAVLQMTLRMLQVHCL